MLQLLVSTIRTGYQLLRLYEIPIIITTIRCLSVLVGQSVRCTGQWTGVGGATALRDRPALFSITSVQIAQNSAVLVQLYPHNANITLRY
jgi:hypothetical protein